MSHHALDVLPLELWLHVAECSPDAWFRLACSLSCVGRYSLHEDVQTRAVTRFCNSDGFLPNRAKHGMHVEMYCLDYKAEVWYRNGQLHRDDGDLPAVIHYHEDGTLKLEEWYRNDEKRRDGDLPAVIRYHEDGTTVENEEWHRNGNRHRAGDLPAKTCYCRDGTTVAYHAWYRNGKWQRDGDLPALIMY